MELRHFLENHNFQRIPLKKLPTGHYKLTLKINAILGDFIIDTGASNSCIGVEFVDTFRLLNEESDVKASGAGSSNMETTISKNNKLEILHKRHKNVPFILFDLSHVNNALLQVGAGAVHGIIGADMLKKWRGIIDYGRNCLYIK